MEQMKTRREFLAMSAGAMMLPTATWALGSKPDAAKLKRQPNIIVLFIDDLGYGDIGAYGCPDIPTPHIDKLAQEGTKFTHAYTNCPVCSPSRTAMMLGMYPQRFGINGNDQRGHPIPDDHPTLAETMRQAGYVTGMVGRWDIGSIKQGPLDRGFMEVGRRSTLKAGHPLRAMPKGPTYMQEDEVYWTDRQGDEMVDFVTRHKNKPFFLYFSPLAIHYPVQEAPQKYLDRVPKSVTDETRRYLAATLIAADDAIGKLMTALQQQGLDENTLVFFTSDNGGWKPDHARNLPFSGGKATSSEGAVRIPFIARWKGALPAGKVYEGITSTMDVYATAAKLARTKLPERCEGVDLLPYIKGEKSGSPHETLYWRWLDGGAKHVDQNVHALRHGRWRLMKQLADDPWRLYDIVADPGETTDLAAQHPDVVAKLVKMYDRWTGELPESLPHLRGPGGNCPRGIGWATPENP